MERVCIFIEGNSFYHLLKQSGFPTRVDYNQLATSLVGKDRQLFRTYYYNGVFNKDEDPEKANNQFDFLTSLERTPYIELRLAKLIKTLQGTVEKGVSTLLASDIVYFAARDFYDTAILISNNHEYVGAVERVKDLGKFVEVGMFKSSVDKELAKVSDLVIDLSEVLKINTKTVFPEK